MKRYRAPQDADGVRRATRCQLRETERVRSGARGRVIRCLFGEGQGMGQETSRFVGPTGQEQRTAQLSVRGRRCRDGSTVLEQRRGLCERGGRLIDVVALQMGEPEVESCRRLLQRLLRMLERCGRRPEHIARFAEATLVAPHHTEQVLAFRSLDGQLAEQRPCRVEHEGGRVETARIEHDSAEVKRRDGVLHRVALGRVAPEPFLE